MSRAHELHKYFAHLHPFCALFVSPCFEVLLFYTRLLSYVIFKKWEMFKTGKSEKTPVSQVCEPVKNLGDQEYLNALHFGATLTGRKKVRKSTCKSVTRTPPFAPTFDPRANPWKPRIPAKWHFSRFWHFWEKRKNPRLLSYVQKIATEKTWKNNQNWKFRKWARCASRTCVRVISCFFKVHKCVHLGKMKNWKIELDSNRGLSFWKLGSSSFFRTRLKLLIFLSRPHRSGFCDTWFLRSHPPKFRARMFARVTRVPRGPRWRGHVVPCGSCYLRLFNPRVPCGSAFPVNTPFESAESRDPTGSEDFATFRKKWNIPENLWFFKNAKKWFFDFQDSRFSKNVREFF